MKRNSQASVGEREPNGSDDEQDAQERRSLVRRGARAGIAKQESAVILALAIMFAVFWGLRPDNFGTVDNLRNLAQDASVLLLLAVGVTYVTVMGCFDLSIGSVLVFSQIVAVKAMGSMGGDSAAVGLVGLAIALASGLAWGLLNGTLIAKLKLSPFIVTLATLGAAYGASQLISGGGDLVSLPASITNTFGIDKLLGIPYSVWTAAVVAVVAGIVLTKTRFGQYTYAVGSDPEAARRTGIRVDGHVVKVYTMMGTLAGLAGYVAAATYGTTSLNGHSNDALNAITAVALGGASLFGGVGTVLGSLVGVSIPAVLQNGLVILDTNPYWNQIIVAAALIASIYLDRRRRMREQRG